MSRVVVDTGVFVSSLIREDSPPRHVFELVLSSHVLLASDDLLNELVTVLERPKFTRLFGRKVAEQLVSRVSEFAKRVEPHSIVLDCRDPEDNYLLALALDGNAEFLITGDRDLLILDPWREVRVVDAATFLSLMAT